MTGSILIAYMLPLCHLTLTLRFSQSSPPGLLAKIYPLLGFDPLLEYELDQVTSMPTYDVNIVCSLEILPWDLFPYST